MTAEPGKIDDDCFVIRWEPGLAVAYAVRLLKIPVTVVASETTTVRTKELLPLENAEATVHGVFCIVIITIGESPAVRL